jgi:hypothetical protein
VLRDPKNVPIVSLDQLFKGRDVALFGRLDQRQFVANGLTYFGLDGAHSWSDAVFCVVLLTGEVVILLGNRRF